MRNKLVKSTIYTSSIFRLQHCKKSRQHNAANVGFLRENSKLRGLGRCKVSRQWVLPRLRGIAYAQVDFTAVKCYFVYNHSLRRNPMKETMIDAKVTYTVEHNGRIYVIEHVPARICKETGEQFFAPETVEHIQSIIKSNKKPDRVIHTPVYEYV